MGEHSDGFVKPQKQLCYGAFVSLDPGLRAKASEGGKPKSALHRFPWFQGLLGNQGGGGLGPPWGASAFGNVPAAYLTWMFGLFKTKKIVQRRCNVCLRFPPHGLRRKMVGIAISMAVGRALYGAAVGGSHGSRPLRLWRWANDGYQAARL